MHVLVRLIAAGACAAAAASAVHAQSTFGQPNPAGLRSTFPAGVNSGSGAAQSGDPVARRSSPVAPGTAVPPVVNGGGPRVPTELFPADSSVVAPNTSVVGAGPVAGPSQGLSGAGGFSAVDTARSFYFADANHDGELTRAEARRLSIVSQSFEESDRNFDGILSRFEYEDSLR